MSKQKPTTATATASRPRMNPTRLVWAAQALGMDPVAVVPSTIAANAAEREQIEGLVRELLRDKIEEAQRAAITGADPRPEDWGAW